MTTKTQQAKIVTPKDLAEIRYPLPRSWTEAAGILKGKKRIHALRYQRMIRREWEKRLERQYRMSRP